MAMNAQIGGTMRLLDLLARERRNDGAFRRSIVVGLEVPRAARARFTPLWLSRKFSEIDLLRNRADAKTLKVFDPKIRGNTGRFVLKFREPAA